MVLRTEWSLLETMRLESYPVDLKLFSIHYLSTQQFISISMYSQVETANYSQIYINSYYNSIYKYNCSTTTPYSAKADQCDCISYVLENSLKLNHKYFLNTVPF